MRACRHSHATLTVLLAVLPAISSFLLPTTPSLQSPPPLGVSHSFTATGVAPRSRQSRLYDYMSVMDSTDLFAVLNLPPSAHKKEMKRAYKRMALNYHPDVITNHDSPVNGKRPNDAFTEIKWPYAHSSQKDGSTTCTTKASISSWTCYNEYTRPNRRTSTWRTQHPNQGSTDRQRFQPYDFNVNQALTDWKEYKDLFNGGAGVVGAGRGSLKSFQGHEDGYAHAEEDDAELPRLLKLGSVQQVAMELKDAELVVQQLDSKRKSLIEEKRMRQANWKTSSFYLYLEKKELDEHMAKLQANIQVVERDLTGAHKRWMALQTRHEQLVETHSRGHHGSSSSQSTSFYSRTTFSPTFNASTASLASCKEESPSQSTLETTFLSTRATAISRTLVSAAPPRQESSSTCATFKNGSTTLVSSAPPPLRQESSLKQGTSCNGRTSSSYTPSPAPQESSWKQGTSSTDSDSSSTSTCGENDAWKHEGFASSRRGRGSSRRRRSHGGDTQSTTTTRGTFSNGSAASSSSEEDARKREGFGSFLERARDSLLAFMISELHRYAQERINSSSSSFSPSTSLASLGSTSSSTKVPSINGTASSSGEDAQKHEKFDNIGRDPGSSESVRGRDSRWTASSSQRHFITSRMLDEHLDNPAQDKSFPPVPNPEISAEAVTLKVVELSPSSERKQTLSTRMAEQQTNEDKKPVIEYENAKASFWQYQPGELDRTSMEKLAGYTYVEKNPLAVNLYHDEILAPIEASRAELIVAAIENAKETVVKSVRRAKSEKSKKEGTRGHLFHKEILAPIEAARTESIVAALENAKETLVESVRRAKSKEAKKKQDNAKKRVMLLTRHIRVLEGHKKKLPTGYYNAENAKGDVLGSLCSIFSIPAKKMDGTPNKANDKRNLLREELGTESPRTVFDDALEDLKQQLVSTKDDTRDKKAMNGTRDDVSATRKRKDNAKKRVLWLTKHISVLEAHKTKLPTGYWMAENAKGGVLGSLCGVFSIPATRKDGTANKADDKRLAIREILGAESPRTVFDDALEDLKQQLVSEMITAS